MHIQILTSDPQGHHSINSEPVIHVQSPSYLLEKVAELEQQVRELQAWKGKAKQILGYFKVACIVHNWPKQSKAIDELFPTPAAPDSG